MSRFTAEELADDERVVIDLGELITVADSVDRDELTQREADRLTTIRRKSRELHDIVRDRKVDEHESDDDSDDRDEPATDGGFIADVAGAEWCPDCQRERIHCVHDRERGERA